MGQPKKRLNARLDADTSQKLQQLQDLTQLNVTELVKLALEQYYASVTSEVSSSKESLKRSGFIGCGEGPKDLSAKYKSYLKSVQDKHK